MTDSTETKEDGWSDATTDLIDHQGALILGLSIGGLVTTLGGGLCCPIFLVVGGGLSGTAWVLGSRQLAGMQAGSIDPEGRGLVNAGRVVAIIGVAFAVLFLLLTLAFVAFAMFAEAVD